MKKVVLLTAVLSLSLLSLSHSFAATFHVSPNGVNSPTCGSISTPCQSIFIAAENAGAGTHIIRVAIGDYFQSVSIPPISDNLTIQGGWGETFNDHNCNPVDTTFFAPHTGAASSVNVTSGDGLDVDFECLRFTRFNNTGGGVSVSAQDSGSTINFTMKNCIVDSHTSGINIQSIDSTAVAVTIEDSMIIRMDGTGLMAYSFDGGGIILNLKRNRITDNIATNSAGGLQVTRGDNGSLHATLTNNIIAGNQGESGGGMAIVSTSLGAISDIVLTNNTVVNNTATDRGGGLFIDADTVSSSVKLRNNIIRGNSASTNNGNDIYIAESYFPGNLSGLDVDYSIVGDVFVFNPAFPYIDGGHNLTADPGLTADYLLRSGSSAINSGQCGYGSILYFRVAPYDDIEGDKRPGFRQLTGCDIGADEYNSLLCFPVKNWQGGMTMICF